MTDIGKLVTVAGGILLSILFWGGASTVAFTLTKYIGTFYDAFILVFKIVGYHDQVMNSFFVALFAYILAMIIIKVKSFFQ